MNFAIKNKQSKRKIMKKEPFIFHSNQKHPSGVRVTVIGYYDENDGILNMSVARCSNKDAFVKKTGRDIAMTRFNEGKLTASLKTEVMSLDRFIGAACTVGDAVIKYGTDVTIKIFEASNMFGEGDDGAYYQIGDSNEFIYTLD
jgi:hypothetical protein